MRGTDRTGFVIQERDRRLLMELATMRVLDREQAKIVAGFGSTTRVNHRLLGLTRAGFVRRFFLGTTGPGMKALYTLSAQGARLIGVPLRGPQRRQDETLAADFFVEHQLRVNEVHCALKFGALPTGVSFRRWVTFFAPIAQGLRLIPDGYAELVNPAGTTALFLEVDLGHEHGPVWRKKVEHYLQFAMMGTPEGAGIHRPFRVLVVAPGARRVESLRKGVGRLTEKIFWFATLESIRGKGLFAPVWRRPTGQDPLPLIKEIP